MTRIVVFAKAPLAGFAKTRLIPALGAEGAAALARQMLSHTLEQALAAAPQAVELCMSPAPSDPAWQGVALPPAVERSNQVDGDLDTRMGLAMERSLAQWQGPVLLIGSDCPALTAKYITEAGRQLEQHDAVLLPADDGGYVLIGLQAPCPEVFTGMVWSTQGVAAETLRRLADFRLRVWLGPTLQDIVEPADLVHLPDPMSPVFK